MNENMVKLLIDADRSDVLREQVLRNPEEVAAEYNLAEQDIARCFEEHDLAQLQTMESKSSSILLIGVAQ